MSTGSALKARILPPADIAPGPVGNYRQCAYLPSFAQSTRSDTKRSMKPLPAHPAPGSVSCHEKNATVTGLRTSCTKMPSFAHILSEIGRKLTATVSCYETPSRNPVTRYREKTLRFGPIWPQQPLRYPIDTRPIPDFRSICSRFASQPDPFGSLLDRIGRLFAHLRIATAMATVAPSEFDPEFGTRRQCGPRRGAQLVQKAAGRISAAHLSPAGIRVPPGMERTGTDWSRIGPQAMIAPRARLPSEGGAEHCPTTLNPVWECTCHSPCNSAAQRRGRIV